MAIRDNIVTPEVRANGLGAIDGARLGEAINQIALTYTFKAKPKAERHLRSGVPAGRGRAQAQLRRRPDAEASSADALAGRRERE